MSSSHRSVIREAGTALALALAAALAAAPAARAVPLLQLYAEGASYDATTESWVVETDSSLRLWTIGNVDGPGSKGTISNVRLAIAYPDPGATPVSISLAPTTTGGLGGFTDPSVPAAPVHLQTVTDGSVPLLSDGTALPSHGIYRDGIFWQEFLLGDFSLTDSPIGDFITAFPDAPSTTSGQINAYEISFSGAVALHFDLYDSVQAGNKVKTTFAPFSHDAETTDDRFPTALVPEPSSLALLGLGFLALGLIIRPRMRAPRPRARPWRRLAGLFGSRAQ